MASLQASNGLIESLRELALLAPDQLAALTTEFTRREVSGRELGRLLIDREWLTAFQVNLFLQGKGRHLVLGPYVLIERIGSGGMGEVFRARHRRLLRACAVKVIGRDRLANPVARERFLREAEATAQLSHPNIVAVHDAGVEGDRHFLAMELIDGLDLGRLLLQSGPLPVGLACEFTRQAALGLHHAHELGYVHRDIKPQNLLVAPKGGLRHADPRGFGWLNGAAVKVLDLGLVRHETDRIKATELALTQRGIVIGTMDYVAPEQARNSHRVDRRADLYSLGCTLYHLLAGQPPFAGGQALDKLLRHVTDTAPPLGLHRPDAPADVQAIVSRLMAKHPGDRYPTALELIHDLAGFAAGKPPGVVIEIPEEARPIAVMETEPTRVIEVPGRVAPPNRWRWWVAVAGGVAAVLAISLAVRGLASRPVPRPVKRTITPDSTPRPAPDHLAHFIPADAAAVVGINPRAVASAPILKPGGVGEAVNFPLDLGLNQLLKVLALKPAEADWARFTFPSADLKQAICLMRTNGDGLVQGGLPGDGREIIPVGGHRLWKHAGLFQLPTFFGGAGRYTVAGSRPERVAAFLDQARGGEATLAAVDPNLREPYRGVGKQASHLWLAVAPPKLGPVRLPNRDGIDEVMAVEVLARCRSITGTASVNSELAAELAFHAHDEAAAEELMTRFAGYRGVASVQLAFSPPKEYGRRLWLRFLLHSTAHREGDTVRVRSTVPAEARK